MKNHFRIQLMVLGLLLATSAWPQSSATKGTAKTNRHQQYNLLGESVGLAGYDPVAYFPEFGGKPMRGLISNSYEHEGITYRFSSKENLNRFKQNPAKYLPAYGGWCAWAVAELGKRVDIDPESFAIKDGKLYVFYRDPALDTRALWQKDVASFIQKGDKKWREISQ
jgi:hypothetical protein